MACPASLSKVSRLGLAANQPQFRRHQYSHRSGLKSLMSHRRDQQRPWMRTSRKSCNPILSRCAIEASPKARQPKPSIQRICLRSWPIAATGPTKLPHRLQTPRARSPHGPSYSYPASHIGRFDRRFPSQPNSRATEKAKKTVWPHRRRHPTKPLHPIIT